MSEDNYQAFMIRVWRMNETAAWRASSQNPHTGDRHYFANPEALLAYLQMQFKRTEKEMGKWRKIAMT